MSLQIKQIYEFGRFRIDKQERTLWRDGSPVPLTPKAFEVLLLLVERSGRLVEKDALMNQVWADSFVEEGNLKVTVSMLRKVLEEDAGERQYIETVPRRGYRFIAQVTEISDQRPELILIERTHAQVLIEEEEERTSKEEGQFSISAHKVTNALSAPFTSGLDYLVGQIKRRGKAATLILAVLVIAIVATAYFFYIERGNKGEIHSIAVLPFTNSSGDADAEYLSDGITESLINSLSKLQTLRVTARTTAFTFKGRSIDPRAAGRELNVDALLTGRVTQRGDTLGIQVDLIRVADGSQLWGEQFHRKLSEILAVQGEIAREISEKMRLRLTGEDEQQLTKRYTESVEAYRLYLRGRYFWNKVTREGLEKSLEYYHQAIDKDPNYALAYAGLADTYVLASFFAMLSPAESYSKGKEAVSKALELDNNLAEAHIALGRILIWYEWKWPAGEAALKRAIELSPNSPMTHQWYGHALAVMGRFDESLAELRRAQELDPLSLSIGEEIATAFLFAGRYDETIKQIRRILDIDPRFAFAYIDLSIALEQTGRSQEAITELQKALSLENEQVFMLSLLGFTYARMGGKEKAEDIVRQLKELSRRKYISPQHIARVYVGLGDRDQAFEWLEKSYQERDYNLPYLRVDPTFEGLRSDPRFADLLRRMNVPQ
jgi:TolB-like protein/DNA-binding winged helix-turn-helix (wHTH) protein